MYILPDMTYSLKTSKSLCTTYKLNCRSISENFNNSIQILIKLIYTPIFEVRWQAVAQLVEVLRYKSEGSGFDSRWCHWNFFIDITLPAAIWS